jgi:FKBP-type peptidyl-prolyl cis-trans isomerase
MVLRLHKHIGIPVILVVLLAAFGFSGCAQNEVQAVSSEVSPAIQEPEKPHTEALSESAADEVPMEAQPETEDLQLSLQTLVEQLPVPETLEDRFSYTYGYLLMEAAMRDVEDLDAVYFARGAYDAGIDHMPLIPEQMMNTVLFEFQDKLISEAARRLEELAAKNLADAESFLAVNGKRQGVITTDSGLQYEVIADTEGDRPAESDRVRVNYRLTYLDGREGDASIRGIPSTFDLNTMIPGFREGLMLMPEGSEYRFYVHPELGYGAEGSTRIEPNTLLIFDVELVEIVE